MRQAQRPVIDVKVPRHAPCRTGFTIFEMLLVLSLIALGMAIAWPALANLSHRQQLMKGAEIARIRLLSARVYAIENGMPYQFRFEPGGQRFCILHGDTAQETALPTGTGTVRLPVVSGKLPSRIQFDQLALGATGGGMILETRFNPLPDAHDLAIVNWSPPIVFQPDGTASDQIIILTDPSSESSAQLELRGLTGGITITRRE